MTDAQPLPLGPLITGAFDRVRFAIPYHVALAYIYILPVLILLIPGLFDDLLATVVTRQRVGNAMAQSLLFLLPVLVWGSAVMVMWYRLTLLGPAEFLRLDAITGLTRAMRFVGVVLLVGAIILGAFLLVALVMLLLAFLFGNGLILRTLGIFLSVSLWLALATSLRFLPSLAAVPLGRSVPLSTSWQLTRGNTGRLVLAALALLLPVLLISGLVDGLVMRGLYGEVPDENAPLADAVAYMRSSVLVGMVLAPLSGAASAFLCGLGAEVYVRLVGPPLDAKGIEV